MGTPLTPPTTLANIKMIAKSDSGIRALSADDPEVIMVINDVSVWITEAKFGKTTEIAQRYAAAHFLTMENIPVGGRGPLSSENVGGISQSFTLPYLNQKTVFGATQYGLMNMECARRTQVAFDVVMREA